MTRISEPSSPESTRAQNPDKRQVKNGESTNDLILSAYSDGNDRTFPRILSLYVASGSLVRMAEGQAVTYKLTKKLKDMRPIETLPTTLRTLLNLE